MISSETAIDIALAHREVKAAKELLERVTEAMSRGDFQKNDLRDAFGRRVDGLQLGVPSGDSGHRLFTVSWVVAKPIIEMHIAECETRIKVLSQKAIAEARGGENPSC